MDHDEEREKKEDRKKRINDDLVFYMRTRRDGELPYCAGKMETYLNFNKKRDKAALARRNSELGRHPSKPGAGNKKGFERNEQEEQHDDKNPKEACDKCDMRRGYKRGRSDEDDENMDACGPRRRRKRSCCPRKPWPYCRPGRPRYGRPRCCRKRRRRGCKPRRPCGPRRRKSCGRRRRRSCRRRRRR